MKRWCYLWPAMITLLCISAPGCESFTDLGESIGISGLDDADEPGDVDGADDAEDDDAKGRGIIPDFGAAKFSNPTRIDNSYFPLAVGTTLTYEAHLAEGTERDMVEVLNDT